MPRWALLWCHDSGCRFAGARHMHVPEGIWCAISTPNSFCFGYYYHFTPMIHP